MSYGKAFGFSILAFIGLNIIFFLVGYGVDGVLLLYFESVAASPAFILFLFLGPILALTGPQFPYLMTQQFNFWVTGVFSPTPGTIILFIGYIVAPVLAAFLSGRFGETKLEAFFGWFITAMLCALTYMIADIIGGIILGAPWEILFMSVTTSIAIGLVYGMAYGSIAILTGREF